jgi:hypothetical protein
MDSKNKLSEELQRVAQRKVEQLEQERDLLVAKHRRDREALELELEERRQAVKKYESELKEMGT